MQMNMAIKEIALVLSAYRPDGQPIESEAFVSGLGVGIAPYERYGTAEAWGAVGLEVVCLRADVFKDFGTERYEALEEAVQANLLAFAEWLAAIPAENMNRMRANGLKIHIVVNLLMDQDQMEFTLPPKLSVQLGRLGISFYMISNE
jgi:hypothetical protein